MNLHQPHPDNLMKTTHLTPICTVQSVTYTPERRVITLTSITLNPTATRLALKRRKASFRLKILMGAEAECSFAPAIQVRSLAKP